MDWTYNILGPDPAAGLMVVLILIVIVWFAIIVDDGVDARDSDASITHQCRVAIRRWVRQWNHMTRHVRHIDD